MALLRRNKRVVSFPVKRYEIWATGRAYVPAAEVGESKTHHVWVDVQLNRLAIREGYSFADACQRWAAESNDPTAFDRCRLTWRLCPLYPSREAALAASPTAA